MLTELSIANIAAAVFEKPGAWVVEAYSEFDVQPRQFRSPNELAQYVEERLSNEKGYAHIFVVYPDMGGRAVRQTIELEPGSVPGRTVRYTWEGWGLISMVLERSEQPDRKSHVSANTEKRATKWATTYPGWDSPNIWNWGAVVSHTRRLQRVLSKVA